MSGDQSINNRLVTYALLAVVGTLLSAWGWWVTDSITIAAKERSDTVAEWSAWRGQTTEKLDGLQRQLAAAIKELEEIKVYLRIKGWLPRQQRLPDAKIAPAMSSLAGVILLTLTPGKPLSAVTSIPPATLPDACVPLRQPEWELEVMVTWVDGLRAGFADGHGCSGALAFNTLGQPLQVGDQLRLRGYTTHDDVIIATVERLIRTRTDDPPSHP